MDIDDLQLLDLPDIRQRDDYSCGACAAMSVGRFFGVGPTTLEEWKKELGTTEAKSTDPEEIIDYLTQLGLDVTLQQHMTVHDLRDCWLTGKPVICPIQEYGVPSKQASFKYGHYVTAVAVALQLVFVQDSSIENALGVPGGSQGRGDDPDELQAPGRSIITLATWDKNWHDKDRYRQVYDHAGIIVGPGVHPHPDDWRIKALMNLWGVKEICRDDWGRFATCGEEGTHPGKPGGGGGDVEGGVGKPGGGKPGGGPGKTAAQRAQEAAQKMAHAHALVNGMKGSKERKETISPERVTELANHLFTMTVKDLKILRDTHELKGSGRTKEELKNRLVKSIQEWQKANGGGAKPDQGKKPPKKDEKPPKKEEKPVPEASKIDENKPLSERIKDYARGDAIHAKILQVHTDRIEAEKRWKESGTALLKHQSDHGFLITPKKGKIRETRKLMAERSKLEAENKQAQDDYKNADSKAHEILAAHIKEPVTYTRSSLTGQSLDAQQRQDIEKGLSWLSRMIGHGTEGRQTDSSIQFDSTGDERSYHQPVLELIAMSKRAGAGTVVHEYGHWMEEHVPGVAAAAHEFLAHRVGNEPLKKLKDLTGNANYEDHEFGRRDDFQKAFGTNGAYVGKDYGKWATEVTSMGLQKMYNDPTGFAKADPEYFKFIVGIMDGSLRKGTDLGPEAMHKSGGKP